MFYGYWKTSLFGNHYNSPKVELFNCNNREALKAYAKASAKSGDFITIFQMSDGLITDYYVHTFGRFIEIEDCEFAQNHVETRLALQALNDTREIK